MPPSGSVVADVAIVVSVSTEPSTNSVAGVTTNARPSLISVVLAGFTSCESVLPLVLSALTVKPGKSPPASTIATPVSVSVTSPVLASIV